MDFIVRKYSFRNQEYDLEKETHDLLNQNEADFLGIYRPRVFIR